jgi:3-hydroxyisobutyrate dehydrogenase
VTIGYVGLGNMGGALARRLQLTYPLLVNDKSDVAIERMEKLGARRCASLSTLAEQCDTIFLCLPTSDQVREVLFGNDGLAASVKRGAVIVDQTTGDPTATRTMGVKLAERGVDLIDAPVSGGPAGADAGNIAIMVGAAPESYERIEPILHAISPNVYHAGTLGTGQVIKLANNMMAAIHRIITLEALALAVKSGVAAQTAYEIILASSGRNFFVEHMVGDHILTGQLATGFTLGLMHKDIRLACQLGMDSDVPLLFGNIAKEFYQFCVSEMGSEAEANSAAVVMDRLAGTKMVPSDYSVTPK